MQPTLLTNATILTLGESNEVHLGAALLIEDGLVAQQRLRDEWA